MSALEEVLKDINTKCIQIDDAEIKKNNVLIHQVLKSIQSELEKNSLFKFLFRAPLCGGSYYKNLKVKKANEYDINLILVLPKEIQQQIHPMDVESYPGTAKLKLNFDQCSQNRDMFNEIRNKLCDSLQFFDCAKVNQWFEGLVQKAINNIYLPGTKLEMCKSGPAKTVLINKSIAIDIVPCFQFNRKINNLGRGFKPTVNDSYFLVPKISEKRITQNPEKYWRIAFTEQESDLLHNLDKLKPAIRILKLIRDDTQQKKICSYFIQTVAMHSVGEIGRTLGETFLMLLTKLIDFVGNKNLPFYWCEDYNLFMNLNTAYLNNLHGYLNRLKAAIMRDPRNLKCHINYPHDEQQDNNEYTSVETGLENLEIGTGTVMAVGVATAAAAAAIYYFSTRRTNNR